MSEDTAPKATKVTPPVDAEPEKTKAKAKAKRSQGRPIALQTELEEFFTMLGAGVMMLDQFDGLVVINQAGENAAALAKLANKNARIKKALEALVSVSSMGAVVGVIGGTAVPILMHHGAIPPGIPMADEWLKPPERIKFEEDVAEAQSQAQGGSNGSTRP